jgi:DMSO/TMAO reductase YedYZ molybdopterin-dependent catalytic subunit
MKRGGISPRRRALLGSIGGAGTLLLAGCDRLSNSTWFPQVLQAGERLSDRVHHLLTSRKAMAQEFTEADLSPQFRSNGTAEPDNPQYLALAANGFVDWQLVVDGLVDKPQKITLAQLKAMKSRTQITRHDCVEGWSAIGKWTGVPLGEVLALAVPKPQARYVVFYCADPMGDDGKDPYYESIDMEDAHHPQTILAYELNGAALPVANGAPVRLRVERQLGYKMAKFVMRIELVESFRHIAGGSGGYWEDKGYQWYAGI